MGISDLPFHRARIGIAIVLAAAVVIVWATTWAQCQPHATGSSYLGFAVFGSLVGCLMWAVATVPVLFSGTRWPWLALLVGVALAVAIGLGAVDMLFNPHAICNGDSWGG